MDSSAREYKKNDICEVVDIGALFIVSVVDGGEWTTAPSHSFITCTSKLTCKYLSDKWSELAVRLEEDDGEDGLTMLINDDEDKDIIISALPYVVI